MTTLLQSMSMNLTLTINENDVEIHQFGTLETSFILGVDVNHQVDEYGRTIPYCVSNLENKEAFKVCFEKFKLSVLKYSIDVSDSHDNNDEIDVLIQIKNILKNEILFPRSAISIFIVQLYIIAISGFVRLLQITCQ